MVALIGWSHSAASLAGQPAPTAPAPSPAGTHVQGAGPAISQPLASQGAYQLGKVRILGVPVITVAAPVLSKDGGGPDATTRAQVIEGNLAMLYRGRNLCSSGEALAEALVHRFLARGPSSDPCGLANASLLGPPEALVVEVVPGEDGLHRLEAKVVGRPQPLPLLTVTPEDARLNGLSNAELAERWRATLQQRLRVARQRCCSHAPCCAAGPMWRWRRRCCWPSWRWCSGFGAGAAGSPAAWRNALGRKGSPGGKTSSFRGCMLSASVC